MRKSTPMGCFKDVEDEPGGVLNPLRGRTMIKDLQFSIGRVNSLEECLTNCLEKNYQYAGVKNGYKNLCIYHNNVSRLNLI